MKQPFQLCLRAGEKIYINGAVLRVDRKVTLELLNDVSFLLENHVIQADEANTPLRQLYFVVQTMLMESEDLDAKLGLFRDFHSSLMAAFESKEVLDQLESVLATVEDGRYFEALRTIRKLFPIEKSILDNAKVDLTKLDSAQRNVTDGSYAA